MKLLIIIPAYNERDNILRVVTELRDKLPSIDYVVINDGSGDDTALVCKKNGLHLIDLPINLGLSDAFRTGMKFAYRNGYDCVLQYDGDGQHDPDSISEMLARMESGMDIVIGSRFASEKKPFSARMVGNTVINFMIRITTGVVIRDSTSGMRMYGRRIMRLFAENANYDPEPDTLAYLIRCGAKVEEVQVHMRERIAGTSYLKLDSIIRYMTRICSSILFMQWFRKKVELK